MLIRVAPKKERDVYEALSRVKEITDLHLLMGEYDLIAKIEAESYAALYNILIDKIRSVDGIVDTETMTDTLF